MQWIECKCLSNNIREEEDTKQVGQVVKDRQGRRGIFRGAMRAQRYKSRSGLQGIRVTSDGSEKSIFTQVKMCEFTCHEPEQAFTPC